MPRRLGLFAIVSLSLVLFVVVFLFATGTLVPWSNSCGQSLGVDPADDVPADADVVPYDSLSPEEQALFDDALSESPAGFHDRRWSVGNGYVKKDDTTYRTSILVC
ncbi:hypothetical protein DEQ92_15720 [Haloferax sp. Atlit-6N]|uniref:DUF7979 domain-containing protein n=1 Tax=Haloferax gibbonsii TaxID=35746 RepID=A0A871BK23_HALGI|nr:MULTISPECIES: hypothetical protein [Haloferax]QOS13084.1 uncharacterized protein HfgLR_14780 [Haloferax gibbonsii]RDZ53023.1 hypothetical protein C5C07_14885 [Haloferax sp. Atlit-4N]REA02326.1 hypothetical protein DEQ92_15720 [Haloferax sp. Atlit-6N]